MRCWAFLVLIPLLTAQPPVNQRAFRLDELRTPPGFEVSVYAQLPAAPRLMTFSPNGVLYVAARDAGVVFAIPAQNQIVKVLAGLAGPHSLVFQGSTLYIAADDGIYWVENAITDNLAIQSQPVKIVDLPTGGQHVTRTAGIGPDGKLYTTAGSTCNFCIENDARRAATQRFNLDGSGQEIYSHGQRNSVGFAWHPLTGDLWATDNGGDGLGDDIPPDEVNILRQGGDYGWPDCSGDQQPVNWGDGANTARCGSTFAPVVKLEAHSAPLGIGFYTGTQFPASYLNDAFVAFHGSWNRDAPTGYKVVRIHASAGHASGVEDFLWGFLDVNTRTESGRPVDPVPGPDGSLYISDDATGNIYRVAYKGPRINPKGIVQRAPGVYEVYGENLASDPAQLTVTANGQPVAVLFAGANQVNIQMPDGLTAPITIMLQNERASDSAVIPQ
jgi:glucose/arabinose dehydrogenase